MEKTWKVFIVCHDRVYAEMYRHDPMWNTTNYAFVNVGQGDLRGAEQLPVIRQTDLPDARALGKQWAESEAIYNIYRSGIYREVDYVGFLQYDKELRLRRRRFGILPGPTNVTERVQRAISQQSRCHVSFETHPTRWDYEQRIMADERFPETLVGDGRNCYDYIISDYNRFFGTKYTVTDVLDRSRINLCSCFLVDREGFERMMAFFCDVVTSGRLEAFDTRRRHRLQGGLAERYFGLFLLLEYENFVDLNLHHRNLKPGV